MDKVETWKNINQSLTVIATCMIIHVVMMLYIAFWYLG